VTEDLLESVDEVVVHHHAPYLLNNVDVIDTPGLNDEDAMTSVTLSVLPRADAAILVISAMAPLSEYTRDFLENKLLSADLGRVLFLVNRIGQLGDPREAGKLLEHVEKRLTENVVERAERIRQGLAGIRSFCEEDREAAGFWNGLPPGASGAASQ